MIIDLHTHSHYSSDGKLSIPELLDYYSSGDIVGISDHETIAGWNEFRTEAEKRGIQPVMGVEWFAGEHHILSYFINGVPDDFLRYMEKRRSKEKECMQHVYAAFKIKYHALPLYDELIKMKSHPEEILSVSVLADAISNGAKNLFKEAVDNIREVRRTLPVVQRQETFFANEIIEKINSWSATSVLAHPYNEKGTTLTDDEIEKKIRTFAECGIKGIEFISGKRDEKMETHILSLCDELDLLPSVGSDFHYLSKGLEPEYLEKVNLELKQRVEKWIK